jgi:hypothetical protein
VEALLTQSCHEVSCLEMITARGVVEPDSHILFVLVYHSDMNYHVVDCNPSSSALGVLGDTSALLAGPIVSEWSVE